MSEMVSINRREFVRLATAAGMGATLPEEGIGQVPSGRRGDVKLQSSGLTVEFDSKTALPLRYRLTQGGAVLDGAAGGAALEILVCRKDPWKTELIPGSVSSVSRVGSGAIRFVVAAKLQDGDAARFNLLYRLVGGRLSVSLEGVQEIAGFELLEVRLARLVSVRRDAPNGWMAHGDTGGALIELATARAGKLAPNQFWGDILSTLPVLMAGDAHSFCLLINRGYMDGGAMSVSADGDGAMGTVLRHRVDGSQCADLNLGKGEPLNCGNASTPNLLVEQTPLSELNFFPVERDWRQAWLTGAHYVRKQLPAKRTGMYDDVFTYGIRLDEPTWPEPATTFEQCEEIIREVAALTGNTPQIVHLWGWQFKGKDTGYPAVNEVDARIGGHDGMMRLMMNARKYNATVTLSDNYDDGYRSSPAWSEDIVARRPDGELYNSRSWTGEKSYILGLAKYVRHGALDRVDYTCKQYKLPGTTHIDVLTYYAVRNDWDRRYPASGYKNLVEGKFRVLDAFHQRGVDVSSEAPRYPFMGKVSFYWQGCGIRPCPMGGIPVPMFAAVYRQVAVWGDGMHRGDKYPGALQVFHGGGPRFMTRFSEDRMTTAETFYLQAVPWMLLHRRNILAFHQEQSESVLTVEGGEVRVSLETGKYSVSLNRTKVATESWVAAPVGDDRVVFYTTEPATLRVPLPSGWSREAIRARAATKAGYEDAAISFDGEHLVVELASKKPVIVFRDGRNADRSTAQMKLQRT
ncbi:MAG: hypothetical protein JST61_15865 [Acidobacteria bacterium]|nr:hypothetical protein [Acidobacteriota bacterium]